jgi:hypothetical protein
MDTSLDADLIIVLQPDRAVWLHLTSYAVRIRSLTHHDRYSMPSKDYNKEKAQHAVLHTSVLLVEKKGRARNSEALWLQASLARYIFYTHE